LYQLLCGVTAGNQPKSTLIILGDFVTDEPLISIDGPRDKSDASFGMGFGGVQEQRAGRVRDRWKS
jgi:hypothetical protein